MSLLLRCRDADMIGPFCDYIAAPETFDDLAREIRVHSQTHNETDITNDDISELEKIFMKKENEKNK